MYVYTHEYEHSHRNFAIQAYIHTHTQPTYTRRPTHVEKSDFFVRAWRIDLGSNKKTAGITTSAAFAYCIIMDGSIFEVSKESGIFSRHIRPQFRIGSASGVAFALNRLVIVDTHTVKV